MGTRPEPASPFTYLFLNLSAFLCFCLLFDLPGDVLIFSSEIEAQATTSPLPLFNPAPLEHFATLCVAGLLRFSLYRSFSS